MNPYPFTLDNKRYTTWNWYSRTHFHQKTAKIPLNAGFSCPNRDGTKGFSGCIYCSANGSGETAGNPQQPLMEQYLQGCRRAELKWPGTLKIPYFQAFTNTYGPLEKIQHCIEPFLRRPEVAAISLATRPDCLPQEVLQYLQQCTHYKEIWLELGLQTIHEETAAQIRRGHTYDELVSAVQRISQTDIRCSVHLINGLPGETANMMVQSAVAVGKLPIQGIKIHMLAILKQTPLASLHFPLLTRDEYVDIVVAQLERIPSSIVVQRLTTDPLPEMLIAPQWLCRKTGILNAIDKRMAACDSWQGKYVSSR